MRIEIEINPEIANQPLSRREKICIYILLIIFRLVIPAKYGHQVNAAFDPIGELIK